MSIFKAYAMSPVISVTGDIAYYTFEEVFLTLPLTSQSMFTENNLSRSNAYFNAGRLLYLLYIKYSYKVTLKILPEYFKITQPYVLANFFIKLDAWLPPFLVINWPRKCRRCQRAMQCPY